MNNLSKILLVIILLLAKFSSAQTAEILIQINSGFGNFSGSGTALTTSPYKINPFGKRYGACYGGMLNLQWNSAKNYFGGFGVGYQSFSGKIKIADYRVVFSHGGIPNPPDTIDISGHGKLNYRFINFASFLGKRISTTNFDIDITIGIEFDFSLRKGNFDVSAAYPYNGKFLISNPSFDMDVCPFLQARCFYKMSKHNQSIGLSAGYYYGIKDFINNEEKTAGRIYDSGEAYSREFRFGIVWKKEIGISTRS